MSSRSPEEDGRRSARRFYRGTPPYKDAARNAEWQRANDDEWTIMAAEEVAAARSRGKCMWLRIDDADCGDDVKDILRRIAEAAGIDMWKDEE